MEPDEKTATFVIRLIISAFSLTILRPVCLEGFFHLLHHVNANIIKYC